MADTVKPGDTITVTPWAGAKQTGQVLAITDCSLVVRTAKQSIDIPLASIKTVRRHQRQPVGRGAGTVLAVANECQDISCAHVALGFVGIAAVIDGFDRLFHPPQVVYRAKKPPAYAICCLSNLPATSGGLARTPARLPPHSSRRFRG